MTYHACCHHDIKESMDYIKEVRPDSTLFGLGVSLGGNILANVRPHYLTSLI